MITSSSATQDRALGGVDVLGFFTAEHGVGEASRGLVETMRTAGLKVNTINYTDTESRTAHSFDTDELSEHKVLFTSVNADHLAEAVRRIGPEFFRDRYVVSQWFWELEVPPPWFREAFSYVDEIWAPTRFIEQMLRRSAPDRVKVVYMPPAVSAPIVDADLTRARFDLDARFMFYFSFDFMSIAKRKNPWGLARAFKMAFQDGEGPQLILKSINGEKRQSDLDRLVNEIGNRSDITLMTDYLTRVEASTLTSLADCYVSLHRSEGLGLTITEAISLGVPTIATGYSGNLDFMDEWNTWRVPVQMKKVGLGAGGYDPNAFWAEPDLEVAARMMREVYENPDVARAKSAKARDHLLNAFSVESAGARMRDRLQAIWSDLEGR